MRRKTLAIVSVIFLAACGGGTAVLKAKHLPPFDTAPATTLRAVPKAKTFTLTGLPGDPRRRAAAVKVNNISQGGIQYGISQADIVAEELVEGGMTRLVAMYQSRLPSKVGPVRSLRSTDSGLSMPTHGYLVNSGGSIYESRLLRERKTWQSHEHLYRSSDRAAPYNLWWNPTLPPRAGHRLAPYFNFVKRPVGPSTRARSVTVQFSSYGHQTTFRYRDGVWVKDSDLAATPFRSDQVLVLRTAVRKNFVDMHGATVYESMTVGHGEAILYWHGRGYQGTWSHKSFKAPWIISTGVPVGRTAIEVVPTW